MILKDRTRLPKSTRGWIVAFLALVGVGFLVIIYTPLANLLAMPLWHRVAPSPGRVDIAVVLSGGRYRDGSLNKAALERTITAVRLYHQGVTPRLLFTGGPCCGQSATALMARLATDLGVPRASVLLEEQSRRTHDSAINCLALLRGMNARSVILVTSPLHILRAELTFAAAGVHVYPTASSERNLLLVSSAAERLALLREVAHEYAGLAFYRMRGWI